MNKVPQYYNVDLSEVAAKTQVAVVFESSTRIRRLAIRQRDRHFLFWSKIHRNSKYFCVS